MSTQLTLPYRSSDVLKFLCSQPECKRTCTLITHFGLFAHRKAGANQIPRSIFMRLEWWSTTPKLVHFRVPLWSTQSQQIIQDDITIVYINYSCIHVCNIVLSHVRMYKPGILLNTSFAFWSAINLILGHVKNSIWRIKCSAQVWV